MLSASLIAPKNDKRRHCGHDIFIVNTSHGDITFLYNVSIHIYTHTYTRAHTPTHAYTHTCIHTHTRMVNLFIS